MRKYVGKTVLINSLSALVATVVITRQPFVLLYISCLSAGVLTTIENLFIANLSITIEAFTLI